MKTSTSSILSVRLLVRLIAIAFSAITAPKGVAEPAPIERVWQLKVAGQPSGTFTESTVTTPDGKVKTKEIMSLEMNRLGSKVSMTTESESVESNDGALESLTGSISSSQAVTRVRATRVNAALDVETEAGGKSYQKKLPLKGPVLGPKGVEKLSRDNLKTEGATASFQMFSAEVAGIVSITRKAIGNAEHGGRKLVKVEETIEGMPGAQLITLDENGRWVTRQQSLPFGDLVMEPSTQPTPPGQSAVPAAKPETTLPSESYDKTMARSNILLPYPRTLTAVTLKLHHQKPDLGWPGLDSSNQRVLEKSDTLRLVEVRGSKAPTRVSAKSETPDESYSRPNALIQSDDSEVIRIAREATGEVKGDFEKARRLQDWVSKNLDFDLGIALAPASEVVRNRRGTCIAYAVLLASLQRAVGLPSRVAMGYAYANGIWGGHAWSEVFIDGQWVALDAALYGPGTADAARLWFGASSGDDQLIKLIAAASQMYGYVDFRVVSFERNGRTIKVPENTARHTIEGNRYSNPWLAFSFEAPPSFRFTKMDAVFPDPTIVELEGPGGARVSVKVSNVGADIASSKKKLVSSFAEDKMSSRTMGKLTGDAASTQKAACFLFKQGNSLWSITVEGESGNRLLEQIATSWRWTS